MGLDQDIDPTTARSARGRGRAKPVDDGSHRFDFGQVNGHIVGTVMKNALGRAVAIAREKRFDHKVFEKPDKNGKPDRVTDVDREAQNAVVRVLQECFPDFGIVAEEREPGDGEGPLIVRCRHPKHDLFFVTDPIDGTKAFTRKQSTGVGSMIALVCDGQVIASFVADVMTGEVYGFRPGGSEVWRLTPDGKREALRIDETRTLSEQIVSYREHPGTYPSAIQNILGHPDKDSLRFKDTDQTGGSIGIAAARLWKGEIGALLLEAGAQMPWDIIPVYGICQRLGFIYVAYGTAKPNVSPHWAKFSVPMLRNAIHIKRPHMIVHGSRLQELCDW